jgi:hypothetical protein
MEEVSKLREQLEVVGDKLANTEIVIQSFTEQKPAYKIDYQYGDDEEDPDPEYAGDLVFYALDGKDYERGTLFYTHPIPNQQCEWIEKQIFENENGFGFYNEAALVEGENFKTKSEAIFAFGKYAAQLNKQSSTVAVPDVLDKTFYGNVTLASVVKMVDPSPHTAEQNDLEGWYTPTGVTLTDHPDDIAVDKFAAMMKAKMAASRAKGRSGWDDPTICSVDVLANMFMEHLPKGDLVDVANFAMILGLREGGSSALKVVCTNNISEKDIREIVVRFYKAWMVSGETNYAHFLDSWIVKNGRALLNKLNNKPEVCELCESLDCWQQAEGTKCPAHTKPYGIEPPKPFGKRVR